MLTKFLISVILALSLFCALSNAAACDKSQLFDAELTLLYDDAVPFELIPKRLEYPLNTQRFTTAKLNEGLQFFKTRFGIDFTNPSDLPTKFKLEKGSFEGYNVYGAVTSKSRFYGNPLIRVYADMLTVTALDSSTVDQYTQAPITKDSIAQFGYYTFVYRNNNTQFTSPIKATSQTFVATWTDAQQNNDWSRTIVFDLSSPEWGQGMSQGVVTMPMHDGTLGRSQISQREWFRFPPTLIGASPDRVGKVSTCQTWLN